MSTFARVGEPELLSVVIDGRLLADTRKVEGAPATVGGGSLRLLWDALEMLVRAHSSLAFDQRIAIHVAQAHRVVLLVSGICGDIDMEAGRLTAVQLALGGVNGLPLLAAALSQALCHANVTARLGVGGKHLPARVLILDGSVDGRDFATQDRALLSCAFAAQTNGMLIDCLALGDMPSSVLKQLADITRGTHQSLQISPKPGELVPHLLFDFLPGVAVRQSLASATPALHEGAVCSCHGTPCEFAFVCSCCFLVRCSAVRICPSCRTRFPPEAKSIADRRLAEMPFSMGNGVSNDDAVAKEN